MSDARSHAERRLERVTEVLHRATSNGGPHPAGGDGVDDQNVRALRDELAVAAARAKSAEARTNELRDEIELPNYYGAGRLGIRMRKAKGETRSRA